MAQLLQLEQVPALVSELVKEAMVMTKMTQMKTREITTTTTDVQIATKAEAQEALALVLVREQEQALLL